MNTPQALILGTVQALTEFLPVSSSAHLVIIQNYLGFKEALLLFDVILHTATLIALMVYFREDIGKIILSLIRLKKNAPQERLNRRLFYFIIIGTVPTVALGLLLNQWTEVMFASVPFTSFMLLITGTLLWISKGKAGPEREIEDIKTRDAFIIGIMQGIAIIPGISRSGATISTGLLRGIKKELAFRYSFLLSIPAIIGALGLELRETFIEQTLPSRPFPWIGGALVAAIVGYFSLVIFRKIILKRKLHIFAYYCWAVGITLLMIRLIVGGLS